LKHGTVLFETHGVVNGVYFPHDGAVISLVVDLKDGNIIETAMVGNDGAVGAGAALDGHVSMNQALVQGAGTASVIDADKARDIAREDSAFRSRLLRHEQVVLAAAQQSAACNAAHGVEERLCRWLLRMQELSGNDLPLTQDFLARMLGVRRTSVSLVAGALQSAGLIKYRRGNIRVLDVEGLKEACCECHDRLKANYNLLYNSN